MFYFISIHTFITTNNFFSKHDQIGQVLLPLGKIDLGQVIEEWKDIQPPPDDKEAVIIIIFPENKMKD